MYAQCDINGNKYLLLESIVDVQKDSTTISLDEQKAAHMAVSTYGVLP